MPPWAAQHLTSFPHRLPVSPTRASAACCDGCDLCACSLGRDGAGADNGGWEPGRAASSGLDLGTAACREGRRKRAPCRRSQVYIRIGRGRSPLAAPGLARASSILGSNASMQRPRSISTSTPIGIMPSAADDGSSPLTSQVVALVN